MHLICASSPRPPPPHLPNPNCTNCVIPGRNEKTKVVQNWGDVQVTKYLPYRSIVGYIIFVLIYGLFVFLLFRFSFVCLLYLLSIFFFYLHLCPFSLSLFHDPDEGHKEFVVEVFENQSRSFPGGDFKPADQNWSDAVTCIPLFCSICSLFKVATHKFPTKDT